MKNNTKDQVKRFVHILLLFFLLAHPLFGDLPYLPVRFKLSTAKKVYQPGERIEFRLKVYNADITRSYPIVLPGTQNKGPKLIRLHFYSVNEKTKYYTCVAKEHPDLKMACSTQGHLSVYQLAPGDSTEIVFFLNDRKNFLTQTASHHELDNPLMPGKYLVHIYYDPSQTELKDLYHYIGSTNDSTSQEKLNFWIGGNVCQYIPIEINNDAPDEKNEPTKTLCTKDCQFCKHIHEGNWKAVKSTIEKNIRKSEDFAIATDQTNWMRSHKHVIWVSPAPQEVLCSLPSYFNYEFIFLSRGELSFFTAAYQWGKVYQSQSGLSRLFRSARPNPCLPGEDLSYVGLHYFGENNCDWSTSPVK